MNADIEGSEPTRRADPPDPRAAGLLSDCAAGRDIRSCRVAAGVVYSGVEEPVRNIDGETVMIRSESGPAMPEVQPPQTGSLGPDGCRHAVIEAAPDEPPGDEAALREVVAIDVPREVIARFTGTLSLNELPERQPEIVFDHGPRSRDDDPRIGVAIAAELHASRTDSNLDPDQRHLSPTG